MSNWENNCNETWVGNVHADIEVEPNPLPWCKRIFGKVVYRCKKCERVREGWSKAEGSWL